MNIMRDDNNFRNIELLRAKQDEARTNYDIALKNNNKNDAQYYMGKVEGFEESIFHLTNCTPMFNNLVGMGDPFERKHEAEQQLYLLDVLKNRIKDRMLDRTTDDSAKKAYIGILATIDHLMTKGESLL